MRLKRNIVFFLRRLVYAFVKNKSTTVFVGDAKDSRGKALNLFPEDRLYHEVGSSYLGFLREI